MISRKNLQKQSYAVISRGFKFNLNIPPQPEIVYNGTNKGRPKKSTQDTLRSLSKDINLESEDGRPFDQIRNSFSRHKKTPSWLESPQLSANSKNPADEWEQIFATAKTPSSPKGNSSSNGSPKSESTGRLNINPRSFSSYTQRENTPRDNSSAPKDDFGDLFEALKRDETRPQSQTRYPDMNDRYPSRYQDRDRRTSGYGRDFRDRYPQQQQPRETRYGDRYGDRPGSSRYDRRAGGGDSSQQWPSLETGSAKARDALKYTCGKFAELDPDNIRFYCDFLDPETNHIREDNLTNIARNLDLAKDGIEIIERHNADQLLVKIVPVVKMMQAYSDHLAELRTQELLRKDAKSVIREQKQREQRLKRQATGKYVNMSWSISLQDLNAKKKYDIEKHLNNGDNFTITVISKKKWERNPVSLTIKDPDALEFELKRREMNKNALEEILNQSGRCTFTVEGDIETSLKYTVTPKGGNYTQPAAEEQEDADHDEVDSIEPDTKQIKQQRKAEKKMALKNKTDEPKQKKDEKDLDDMYSFVIEE
ncbi:AIM23 [[Candida] subhashii]|uniref:Altered inheritance of mitochondria protein 23, mitochondrial n=1 Tax=[Candida] subhashii TaxID=561895 RepID=A0A8J5UM58_9ASCO|nr:AIM23 [[Candida] subhashii]KAG7663091.1 AIM23 [[Candida] subhashii]